MLSRIFPTRYDNDFHGQRVALWLMGLLTFMKVGIALVALFRADGGAQTADGIPLDTFAPAAATAVIGVVAYLGLADLFLGLLAALALVRYRSMVPLMYVLIVLDYLGHRGIGLMKPIARTGTESGGYVTIAIFAVSVVGLVLSVSGRGYGAEAV